MTEQFGSPSEQRMWSDEALEATTSMTAQAINEKYVRGEQRIVTESNREKLPNFVEALRRPGYMDLKPFYQRRIRWSRERQSKLIESFIINVPVPPIFLYEQNYNSYEVMDGQQRITAIKDFYENTLVLEKLEIWPELNGKKYSDLPSKVKAGIDRRAIDSIVLLKESAPDDEEAFLLRQLVFERLNTGGIRLEKQEIRNALYQGALNNLLLELSRLSIFRLAWSLPLYEKEEEDANKNPELLVIPFYQKMEDVEVVLRFFAIRHIKHYKYGLQKFLDLYMLRSKNFPLEDILFLRELFTTTLTTAHEIYGGLLFKPYDPKKGAWSDKAQKSYSDAVLIGISKHLGRKELMIERKELVIEATRKMFERVGLSAFTGRANTKRDVEERLNIFSNMLESVFVE